MVVIVCRLDFVLHGCGSLKAKRAIVRRIVERSRSRFQVAAAEVADMDVHRRASLGFAVVSNEGRHAQSVLDKLCQFASTATEAELVDRRVEVLNDPFDPAAELWDTEAEERLLSAQTQEALTDDEQD